MPERSRPSTSPTPTRVAGGGFTLIELLIVIVIIGILVSVAVTVASKVTQGGRAKLTEQVIRALDQAATSFASEREGQLPSFYTDSAGTRFPIVDGRYRDRSPPTSNTERFDRDVDPPQPTTSLFLLAASESSSVDAVVKNFDAKLVERRTFKRAWGWKRQATTITQFDDGGPGPQPPSGLIIKDGFGRPIRMVVPAFQGGYGDFRGAAAISTRQGLDIRPPNDGAPGQIVPGTFWRSYRPFTVASCPNPVGDSDEGITKGSAYFYSAGADGDPGTRDDNIYTIKPTFPLETQKYGT